MLRAMLYVQWKAARWLLTPFVLLGFGLPLLVLRMASRSALDAGEFQPQVLLGVQGMLVGSFAVLAGLIGVLVGLISWSWDHRLGHVYALSLPVSRARYVLLRFAAGALLLAIPVAALWAGALAAVLTTPIPPVLRAYPVAFGFRFLVATLLAFAATFAFAAGTIRTTLLVFSSLIAFLVLGDIAVDVIEGATGATGLLRPVDLLNYALVRWPGPFHVFGGSWMLIDV